MEKISISRTVEGSGGNDTRGGEVEPTVTFNSPSGTTTESQVCRRSRSKSRSRSRSRSENSSNGSAGSSSSSSRKRMRGSMRRGSMRRSSSNMLCATHGSISVCGRRREMEDTVTVEQDFVQPSQTAKIENENFDFYAVYDGHGGSVVAQVCKDRLHQLLADEIHEVRSSSSGGGVDGGGEEVVVVEQIWERMMKSSFMKIDEEIVQSGVEEEMGLTMTKSIGSTAVVAVVSKEKLVVANCGDSRAVLCCGGVAIPLSSDHKPDRPDELERVEAAGGMVIDWNGYRVLGVLATSRSLGDHYLKPYVISEPEVTIMDRTTNDEFLILASDGLWDVMSNEIACDVVRRCLDGRIMRILSTNVEGNNAGEAAAMLAELAMARGSKDNISVIIVELNQSNRNLI